MQKTLEGKKAEEAFMIRHCPVCHSKLIVKSDDDTGLDFDVCSNPRCEYTEG